MGFRWAAARRHVGAPAGVSGRGVPRGTPFHPPIPAVSPAGLSRARGASSGTPPRLATASGRAPGELAPGGRLPGGMWEPAAGVSGRGVPRGTPFHPPIPAVSPAGLSRARWGQLGHASKTGYSLRTGSRRIGSRWTAARRRVEPAAGVPGRGATWTSFRLLVPGLALLGGRVHEAVPAALPQRVSSRSLRTGETRLRRRQQPVTSVGRRRQRCGGPAAVAPGRGVPRGTPSIPMFPRVSPSGCGVRLPGAGPPTNASAASRDRAHGGWPRREHHVRSPILWRLRAACHRPAAGASRSRRSTWNSSRPTVRSVSPVGWGPGSRAPTSVRPRPPRTRPTHGRAARTAVVPASAAAPGDDVSPDGPPERVRPDVFHVEPHARTVPVAPSPCREDVGASRVLWRGALHLM